MTISDSFTSEHVGFVPVRICFGSPETFPVEPALGNVALARKHLSPAIPVTVLHPVSVEEEPGEVILHVDIHRLAAFDEGIEECRNLRTGLGVYDSLELPRKITKIPQKDRINPGALN